MKTSKCHSCWKHWICECPLLCEVPKNIISCSAYAHTDAYIRSQELTSEFIRYLVRCKHDANWTIDDTIKIYKDKQNE